MTEDVIENPSHYTWLPSGVEPIDISEHLSFNLGTVVNYVVRSGHKGNPVQDLKKARWHLEREIKRLEGGDVEEYVDKKGGVSRG
jgi:hypothetical protein